MKHTALFCILFIYVLALPGQVLEWKSHFLPSRAQNMLEEEITLFLPTDAGLLEVDKATGNYSLWNKINGGLPSNTIEAVARHPVTRQLFIGTYDVALLVREEDGSSWAPLPYPEEWEASLFQPLLTYCLQFDAEGMLWAGTNQGLAKFDGESWELYNQEDGHQFLSWVKNIEPAPDGGIYVASHVVHHVKDGVFTPLSTDDFQSEDFIFSYGDAAMCQQSDGTLWFFTDVGSVGRYKEGQWQVFHQIDSLNFFSTPPRALSESPAGELVAYFGNDAWYRYSGDAWQAIPAPPGIGQPLFFSYTEGGSIAVNQEKVVIRGTERTQAISFPEYPFSMQPYAFRNDPQGQLWARDGLALRNLDSGAAISLEEEGAPGYFSSYAFNEQGELWAAQHGAVFQQTSEGWTRHDHTNTILPDATNSWRLVAGPDNTVWLGIYNQGLYSFRSGVWKKHQHPTLNAYNISEMIPAQDGALWLQLWALGAPTRIAYMNGEDIHILEDGEQGFRQENWQRLAYDPATGLLWTLDWAGLQKFDGQSWEPVEFPFEPAVEISENFRSFSIRGDRMLIASDRRIFLRDNGQWFVYSSENAPLANEDVREVGLSQSGKLWIVHQGVSFVEEGQLSLASASESPEPNIKQVAVFPNPAGERAFLYGIPGGGRGVAWLFDAQGRPAGSIPVVFNEGQPAALPLSDLLPGWYAGQVDLNGQLFVFRMLKAH